MTLDTRLSRSGEEVSCEVDGEIVILSLLTGEYYGLNSVAADIWERVQGEITLGELRDQLVEAYEVDPEECLEGIGGLVRELSDWGLLEFSP